MRRTLALLLVVVLAGLMEAGERRRPVRPPFRVSLEPAQGPIAGGTSVSVRGAGFTASTTVSIDGASVPATLVNASVVRIVMPAHDNGFVPVVITTGAATHVAEFLYLPPALASLPRGHVTTVAGIGKYLAEGRAAREAPIEPADVAIDEVEGDIYLAEPNLGVIRRIGTDGRITRFAGIGADFAGDDIGDGGQARDATIVFPFSMTVGPDRNVYVADSFNHRIRRVDRATGVITTVAGSGPNGSCCVIDNFAGDGGPATDAKLNGPNQVAFDSAGNMFILDGFNVRIRKVATDGIISTVAGTGVRGFSGDGGPATNATFDTGPNADTGSLAIDADDNLYLADIENRRVRRIDARTNVITTVAGGGTRNDDGAPATDSFLFLQGIAIDAAGHLYVSDFTRIRRIGDDGRIATVYGDTAAGFSADGTPAPEGRLSSAGRFKVGADGSLYVLEFGTARLRRITGTPARISTIAGIGPAIFGENGPGVATYLNMASQLALTPEGRLLAGGDRVWRLDPDGALRAVAGGGFVPRGPAPSPRPALGSPLQAVGLAVGPDGRTWITSFRELGYITEDGTYVSLCCSDYGFEGDGGPIAGAKIDNTANLAFDSAGNLYIADTYNHRIRRLDATTGVISTVAGTAPPHLPNLILPNPSSGDGGPALNATFNAPNFIAIDGADNLYVADSGGIRMVDRQGIVDTVLPGCTGPMTTDAAGRVVVYCGRIMRLDTPRSAIELGRVGGGGMGGDGGPASEASFGYVGGVAVGPEGDVYLFNTANRRIRAIRRLAE